MFVRKLWLWPFVWGSCHMFCCLSLSLSFFLSLSISLSLSRSLSHPISRLLSVNCLRGFCCVWCSSWLTRCFRGNRRNHLVSCLIQLSANPPNTVRLRMHSLSFLRQKIRRNSTHNFKGKISAPLYHFFSQIWHCLHCSIWTYLISSLFHLKN